MSLACAGDGCLARQRSVSWDAISLAVCPLFFTSFPQQAAVRADPRTQQILGPLTLVRAKCVHGGRPTVSQFVRGRGGEFDGIARSLSRLGLGFATTRLPHPKTVTQENMGKPSHVLTCPGRALALMCSRSGIFWLAATLNWSRSGTDFDVGGEQGYGFPLGCSQLVGPLTVSTWLDISCKLEQQRGIGYEYSRRHLFLRFSSAFRRKGTLN